MARYVVVTDPDRRAESAAVVAAAPGLTSSADLDPHVLARRYLRGFFLQRQMARHGTVAAEDDHGASAAVLGGGEGSGLARRVRHCPVMVRRGGKGWVRRGRDGWHGPPRVSRSRFFNSLVPLSSSYTGLPRRKSHHKSHAHRE